MLSHILSLSISAAALTASAAPWQPAPAPLSTTWGATVTPENAWRQYPRPTMVRADWLNLNGLWQYEITDGAKPSKFESSILVPFPIESSLSGVGKLLEDNQTLWYQRTFTPPEKWNGKRIILHVGAADWSATLLVNGKEIGSHVGGYTPFSFDITDALKPGENQLQISVKDPTDSGGQPRGKQWHTPHGIWYTRTSGIWQTVWAEAVPTTSIGKLKFESSLKDGTVACDIHINAPAADISCEFSFAGNTIEVSGSEAHMRPQIKIASPHAWSPDDPYLYEATITLKRGKEVVDKVTSYFAFRDVAIGKDSGGINRLLLNSKPIFHFGPLDQGFWPDGLYTPPNEEAMKFDIEAAKKMGCNMLRKHVKVESELFYYWCDRMGIMVWQDIPSPFFANKENKEFAKSPALDDKWKQNFERETEEIIHDFGNHPSIVMWVPWNEGWGQNDLAWSKSVVEKVKKLDPSRLVNNASGWTDMKNGDVSDIHAYPNPNVPALEENRAAVLGEYGGLGLPVDGHTLLAKNNWGYKSYKNSADLTAAYIELTKELPPLIAQGLCAAVYTQTTDVEIEVNGWLTYDRKVWKIDPAAVKECTAALYGPIPSIRQLLANANQVPASERAIWKYTFTEPLPGWEKPAFNYAGWKEGKAGFGTNGTPGAVVETVWSTNNIWLTREFTLSTVPAVVQLSLYHDEDAVVYINGILAAKVSGYRSGYGIIPISDEAQAGLKVGVNSIAIHCRQSTGGQGVDAGLVELVPAK